MEGPLWDAMEKGGYSFPEWVTKERLFDLSLLEFQAVFWQINGDIQEIEKVLAPADDDRQGKQLRKMIRCLPCCCYMATLLHILTKTRVFRTMPVR